MKQLIFGILLATMLTSCFQNSRDNVTYLPIDSKLLKYSVSNQSLILSENQDPITEHLCISSVTVCGNKYLIFSAIGKAIYNIKLDIGFQGHANNKIVVNSLFPGEPILIQIQNEPDLTLTLNNALQK